MVDQTDYPGGLLARIHSRPIFLTYQEVEHDIYTLAARLVSEFGQSAVRNFQYAAIPRGGLFILGILSYILNLPVQRLASGRDSSSPLVVVDDCSLSGARFAEYLQEEKRRPIIFAPLCSHPDLRAAILRDAPDVIGCLSARDLKDLAPELYTTPKAYSDWQKRWHARTQNRRFWIGLPELVIFPWNEPDRPVWNPKTKRIEDNWRLASPDRCLKNWGKLEMLPRLGTKAAFRVPDQVVYTIHRDDVTLCNLQDGTVYGLGGSSAAIWRGLAAYGDLAATRDYLLEIYAVDAERVTADIHTLVKALLAKGLLEPVNAPSPA